MLVQTMMALALSPGAEQSYDTGTTHWFVFVMTVWGDPKAILDPTDWVLACFVAWLSMMYVKKDGDPLKAGSIRTYLYGVQSFYTACGIPGILKKSVASRTWAVFNAVKKFSPTVCRVMPITPDMVSLIVGFPVYNWDDETFQLAVLLGFFFLLRVGEMAETDAYPSSPDGVGGVRQLRVSDLEFSDVNHKPLQVNTAEDAARARFLHLNVHASKTDQTWLGCLRLCEAVEGPASACPVRRAARYVALAKGRGALPCDPLLTRANKSPADDSWFRKSLKAALGALVIDGVQVDPSPFNTHSLRAGGATRLFELGKTPQFIAMMGRWTSDAVLQYIRLTDFHLFRGVSSAMAGTAAAQP